MTDVALIIEGKKVYVLKQFLATQSAYFKTLFLSDFKESKENEITLEDVKLHEFITLLKILYRQGEKLKDTNVEFLLNLADKFDMQCIIDKSESFLLKSDKPRVDRKLRLSDQYRLTTLNFLFVAMAAPPLKKNRKETEDNCIRLNVKNPSELTEIISPTKIISNFPWKLKAVMFKETQPKRLDIYLHCLQGLESNVWFSDPSFKVTLVNQEDPTKSFEYDLDNRYGWKSRCSGCGFQVSEPDLTEILNPDEGFIKDDAIVIEAQITVRSKSGENFRKKPDVDFLTPSELTDVILVVEGKKIHVGKQMLATQSSFFKTLFYGEFKESKETEIILE
ncbi:hypothetical protein PFISCL1PPCAC_20267 [Pristionchus fissidentatus]|uniref:BTB domain-containing protein n=1 Tax=Pristionchus fissidentatus TaxID=1538716 RepID=A0AAV5WB85_9BILA|nr:hypothetical protein PFISCL1PPCAC_20267 [Pristionchus fissidentatus]